MKRKTFAKARSAFTLIELLLVLVILGVLAAIVVPKLVNRGQEAKVTATKTQIDGIKSALNTFETDNSRFPTQDEGLMALVEKPANGSDQWHKLFDKLPVDGWGHPFKYQQPGNGGKDFDIISFGPDGQEGGGDDISN